MVEARASRAGVDAGEGLFAKTDLARGQVIALFNGIRKQFMKSEGFTSDYVIRLNSQIDLDIPNEYKDLKNYCATIGHKANHSFLPNAKWSRLDHPRFGMICSITALTDIKKGDEVLVNYGLGMGHAPDWYKGLWINHCRNDKKMSDEDIRDWCGRQYAMKGVHIDLDLSVKSVV